MWLLNFNDPLSIEKMTMSASPTHTKPSEVHIMTEKYINLFVLYGTFKCAYSTCHEGANK